MENVQIQNSGNEDANPALHFFLYLITFFSLTFVVFGVGSILFQFINKYFPDSLSGSFASSFDQSVIKFGIAALFVAAPIFFMLSRLVTKYIRSGTIVETSIVRRWLTYIVLFFAAGTIIGDLIALIMNFLEGDIPVRFLLKVSVILLLAGSIFGYYFWDIRKKNMAGVIYAENMKIAGVAILVVLVVFVSGFFIIDSPSVAREKKIDQQSVSDLQNVDSAVHEYFINAGVLPEKLDDLKKGSFLPGISAEGGLTYAKTQENSYELCANFVRSDIGEESGSSAYVQKSKGWEHGSGKVCFPRVIVKQANAPLIK